MRKLGKKSVQEIKSVMGFQATQEDYDNCTRFASQFSNTCGGYDHNTNNNNDWQSAFLFVYRGY